MNPRKAAITILAAALLTSKPVLSCEVVKVEAMSAGASYAGSAVPVNFDGRTLLISADHFYPSADKPSSLQAIIDGKKVAELQILRRDWASDLVILSATDSSRALERLKACEPRSETARLPNDLVMKGYLLGERSLSSRSAALADERSPETRIAVSVPLIKVVGVAERGMSGGALLTAQGEWAGLLLQEWHSPRFSEKGGAYALPARAVMKRVAEMLKFPAEELPLPFRVDRSNGELRAYGLRFRDSAASQRLLVAANSGGHPDGIGGQRTAGAIEVLGFSGEAVPDDLKHMEQILRRINEKGGFQMLIRDTDDGRAIPSIVALGRLLLENTGTQASLPLDYSLVTLSPGKTLGEKESIDTLLQQCILDLATLTALAPSLEDLRKAVSQAHAKWVQQGSLKGVASLFAEPAYSRNEAALNELVDADIDAWQRGVDLRAKLLKIKRLLR